MQLTIKHLVREKNCHNFIFGGYGRFDDLCYKVVNEEKKQNDNIKRIFYLAYYKHNDENSKYYSIYYDNVIFPMLENVYPKVAILYRNQQMIDDSEICIFYVTKKHGGAYRAYKYAEKKGKVIINLAKL